MTDQEFADAVRKRMRFCELCERLVPARETECRQCGADTVKVKR